jgi:hypothetical protein
MAPLAQAAAPEGGAVPAEAMGNSAGKPAAGAPPTSDLGSPSPLLGTAAAAEHGDYLFPRDWVQVPADDDGAFVVRPLHIGDYDKGACVRACVCLWAREWGARTHADGTVEVTLAVLGYATLLHQLTTTLPLTKDRYEGTPAAPWPMQRAVRVCACVCLSLYVCASASLSVSVSVPWSPSLALTHPLTHSLCLCGCLCQAAFVACSGWTGPT